MLTEAKNERLQVQKAKKSSRAVKHNLFKIFAADWTQTNKAYFRVSGSEEIKQLLKNFKNIL